jgi:uncharacterized protein DUF6916
MSVSRRTFLVAGQTLLAAAALPLKFFGSATLEFGSAKTANLASWTKGTFEPLVSSSFAVHSGARTTAWFTLLSVEDMNSKTLAQTAPMAFGLKPSKAPQPAIDTFVLHFHGTGEALPQGTYELEHHALGKFSLFVVPSGTTTYTAIISHIESTTPIQAPKRLNSKAQAGAPTAPESL